MHGLVLVIAHTPGSVAACLAAARQIAGALGNADIQALHVRTDPVSTILPSEEILTKKRAADFSKTEADRAAAVHQAYVSWLSGSEPDTQSRFSWIDVEGTVEREVRQRGCEADVIVLAQPGKSLDLLPSRILRTAVLQTDRPVLVIPRDGGTTFGRSIAILWGDDRRTTKAVLNAMPLLAKATHVYLLTGRQDTDGGAPDLPRLLVGHDVQAEIHVIAQPACRARSAFLDCAHEVGADLLVMGAYPRPPLAELLTGGTTRFMISRSDLPLFLRH